MPESLDIIEKIDSDSTFGSTRVFAPLSNRADLRNWQNSVADTNRIMQR